MTSAPWNLWRNTWKCEFEYMYLMCYTDLCFIQVLKPMLNKQTCKTSLSVLQTSKPTTLNTSWGEFHESDLLKKVNSTLMMYLYLSVISMIEKNGV